MNPMTFDFQKQPGQARTRFYAPDAKDALVSVVTPFYNAGKYFAHTFNSVMNQTFPWFEWIIVNDGSPSEEDVALLHRFAATDPRITVITQENGGPSKARNTAVAHANTDLIVPLDADDLLDPTYLECLYWALRYHPEAAWSFSNSYGFQEMEYVWNPPFDAETMKTRNLLALTSMIRKKDFEQIGGLKIEDVPYHEDWRLWLDLLSAGKKPVHVASHLFWYRRLNTGRSSGVNGSRKLARRSDQIIRKAASTVDKTVQAVAFPLPGTADPDHTPTFSVWTQETDPDHKNTRILWLTHDTHWDILATLKQQGFDSFILSTAPVSHLWRQQYENCTDECFCLPDFLDPAHYPEFVSYYIQSRHIDLVLLCGSRLGDSMLPWLRQHFPNLPIADYMGSGSKTACGLEPVAEQICCGTAEAVASELTRLLKDEDLQQQRNRLSEHLQQSAPTAAESYAADMRTEKLPAPAAVNKHLAGKVLDALREEGLRGLFIKTTTWLKRKIRKMLHLLDR